MKHFIFYLFMLLILIDVGAATNDFFPKNYEASKKRFLGYQTHIKNQYAGVETRSIEVSGLSVDSLFIPAQKEARQLIIITSGNHGPEAYAGSALQAIFIEQILGTLNLERTGVLLIHALNPWGFKHHRRGTENNVNLNRNFDVSPKLFETKNPDYDVLRSILEPQNELKHSHSYPAATLISRMLFEKGVTQQSLTNAIGTGQYSSSRGINYGGQSFEKQTLNTIDLLKEVAAPYQAIFHIDLHTGLGKKNVLHIMTKNGMNDHSNASQAKLFNSTSERGMYEITPPGAQGFYDIDGDYAGILNKIFLKENKVIIGITAEFGTVGNGLVGKTITINRLILENQGFYHGHGSFKVEKKVKTNFLELFNPSSAKWRNQVLVKGHFLLDTVVKRFIKQNP